MTKSNFSKSSRAIVARKSSPQSAKHKDGSKGTSLQSNPPAARDVLTPRERAVLKQIGRGASSKEAGAALGVSARTIEFHRANIRRKLGAKNIVDLLILAFSEDVKC
jgi:DNA-binding CsgD family transcriptional regulator